MKDTGVFLYGMEPNIFSINHIRRLIYRDLHNKSNLTKCTGSSVFCLAYKYFNA